MNVYVITRNQGDWDENAAMVVRAPNAKTARRCAHAREVDTRVKHEWLSPEHSEIRKVPDDRAHVILVDFQAG